MFQEGAPSEGSDGRQPTQRRVFVHSQFIDMMTETDELVGFLAFFVDMMEHKKIHCINEIFFLTSAQKKTLCI